MQKGPIIDHDPRETPRPDKGETAFVTIITFIVLTALGSFLSYVFKSHGYPAGFAACAILLAIGFAVAFWLERRSKPRRW